MVSDIKNAENYSLSASSWRFLADVRSLNNYYPYGLKIDKGSWSSSNYQFAYNGKQEEVFDKDFLHYGARTYNSELDVFITTDPLEHSQPFQSPYIYANSNPIKNVDANGLIGMDPGISWEINQAHKEAEKLYPGNKVEQANFVKAKIDALNKYAYEPVADYYLNVIELLVTRRAGGFGIARKNVDLLSLTDDLLDEIRNSSNVEAPLILGRLNHSAELVNADFVIRKNYSPPFKEGTTVSEYTTQTEESFVRVFKEGKSKNEGRWIMRAEDVKDLSPEQIKDKFGLEYEPNKIVDVKLPAGTRVYEGIAGPQEQWNAKGGRNQIFIKSDINKNDYGEPRNLESNNNGK